jgi:hypothetical protein
MIPLLNWFAEKGMPWSAWLFLVLLLLDAIAMFVSARMTGPRASDLYDRFSDGFRLILGALVGSMTNVLGGSPPAGLHQ